MIASEELVARFFEATGDQRRHWNRLHGGLRIPPALMMGIRYPVEHAALPAHCVRTRIREVTCQWWQLPVLGTELNAELRRAELFQTLKRGDKRQTFLTTTVDYTGPARVPFATCTTTAQCLLEEDDVVAALAPSASKRERPSVSSLGIVCSSDRIAVGASLPLALRDPLSEDDVARWEKFVRSNSPNPIAGSAAVLSPLGVQAVPIENGILRFAFVASLISQWLGDIGSLSRLRVILSGPAYLSDTIHISGKVQKRILQRDGQERYGLELFATNGLGEEITHAWSEVVVQQLARLPKPISVSFSIGTEGIGTVSAGNNVLDWFANFAHHSGSRAALIGNERTFTYGELEAASASVAGALAKRNVQTYETVALCMPRTLHMVVAFLGILKAGATCLFIDPHYPVMRQERMLRGAQHLLYSGVVPDTLPINRQSIAAIAFESLHHEDEAVPRRPAPGQVAYRMFTSGSCGEPKPVSITHEQLALAIQSLTPLGYRLEDVCLHTASFSFSASIRQLFGALTRGAAVVLAPAEVALDPLLRLEWIAKHGVTIWDTTPSALRQTCDLLRSKPTLVQKALFFRNSLRRVQVTGEPLHRSVLEDWAQLAPSIPVFNLYSQTETAGTVSFAQVDAQAPFVRGIASVGLPLPGNCFSVRNEAGDEMEAEQMGEIFLSSDRLRARQVKPPEYGNLLDRNDAKEWHATGDVGIKLTDGQLVVIGRHDGAVNIRGYRVSPAEIEAVLIEKENLREAAVLAAELADGRLHLCAFVPAEANLSKSRLRECLPRHMLPDRIYPLSTFPRLPNGKLDRAALRSYVQVAGVFHTPASSLTETERFLAHLWEAETGTPVSSNEVSFFDCGGDSLSAVRMMAAIERSYAYALSIQSLYEFPTLKEVAALIDGRNNSTSRALTVLKASGVGEPIFFVAGLGGHTYQFLRLTNLLSIDCACYGLEYPEEPMRSVEEIASYMISGLRKVQPFGPYYLAGHSLGGRICYEMARQLRQGSESVCFLGLLDASAPVIDRRGQGQQLVRLIVRRTRRFLQLCTSENAVGKIRLRMTERAEVPAQLVSAIHAERHYRPGPYGGSAVLFKANAAPALPTWMEKGETLGWHPLLSNLLVIPIDGDHLSILAEPHVLQIAAELSSQITRAGRDHRLG